MTSTLDTAGNAAQHGGNRPGGARTLGEQSSRVASEVHELGRVALDSAGDAASKLKEKGGEMLEHGREKAKEAKGQFDTLVSNNPMKSVLIAAGIGAALGFMLSRRSN